MDSLLAFMRETYVIKPDNRIPVKEIYDDFRLWIIVKFGISVWNNITQRQVYTALKEFPDYAYVRYREGFCLKGISKIVKPEPTKITLQHSPSETQAVIPKEIKPITLNIIPIKQLKLVQPEASPVKDKITAQTIIPEPNTVPKAIQTIIPEPSTVSKATQIIIPENVTVPKVTQTIILETRPVSKVTQTIVPKVTQTIIPETRTVPKVAQMKLPRVGQVLQFPQNLGI